MLELPRLIDQVNAMGDAIARRRVEYASLVNDARAALLHFDQVDDRLKAKIEAAKNVDSSWRGARPLEDRLNARTIPDAPDEDASLIAVDGSQIYPDRHGPALYYLINIGVIILRQGTGEAPLVSTHPRLFYREEEIYSEENELLTAQDINDRRELAEMEALAHWSQEERRYWGGDLGRLILAMTDGPLLTWAREEDRRQSQSRLRAYLEALQGIRDAGAIPVGYVARPRSANVLRLLHVAQLEDAQITKANVRATRYRALTDTALFHDLRPNERSALFSSTAQANEVDFRGAGQEIAFFYLNVAREGQEPHIARVELPRWAAKQKTLVDRIHRVIYEDARETGYPYVLIRAHELALVTYQEREELESMLNIAVMSRTGEPLRASIKASLKRHF